MSAMCEKCIIVMAVVAAEASTKPFATAKQQSASAPHPITLR